MDFINPDSKRKNAFRDVYDHDRYVNAVAFKDNPPPFPLLVDVELTNHCNLRCFFCGQVAMTRKRGYISEAHFKKVIDECAEHGAAVRLIRWGEPFLHERIVEFCRYIKNKGNLVHVTTNGIPIEEDQMNHMVDMELDSIKFSFQGATKAQYQEMRNSEEYDKLHDNILKFIKIRGDGKKPYFHISSTMTNETEEEIEKFVKYWSHIVDSVGVGMTNLSAFSPERIKSAKLRRQFENLKRRETLKKEYRPCGEVYRKLSVDWDGKISACCSDFDNELTVGHIEKSSMEEVWENSMILRSIRTLLDHGQHRALKRCSTCYQYYEEINNPNVEYE